LSGKVAESSADTSEVGIKKMIAAKRKKKMSDEPKRADAGKFRMLSIALITSKTRRKSEIFLRDFFIANHFATKRLF